MFAVSLFSFLPLTYRISDLFLLSMEVIPIRINFGFNQIGIPLATLLTVQKVHFNLMIFTLLTTVCQKGNGTNCALVPCPCLFYNFAHFPSSARLSAMSDFFGFIYLVTV